MISQKAQRRFEAAIEDAELLLGNWRLIASSDGRLNVQPLGPCLSHGDMQIICDRLHCAMIADLFKEVTIDLGARGVRHGALDAGFSRSSSNSPAGSPAAAA